MTNRWTRASSRRFVFATAVRAITPKVWRRLGFRQLASRRKAGPIPQSQAEVSPDEWTVPVRSARGAQTGTRVQCCYHVLGLVCWLSSTMRPSVSEKRQAVVWPCIGLRKSIGDFRADPAYRGDGNRIDLAFAIYALARGEREDAVRAAICTRNLAKKGPESRQHAYLSRTIAKARQQLAPGRAVAGSTDRLLRNDCHP